MTCSDLVAPKSKLQAMQKRVRDWKMLEIGGAMTGVV